MYKFYTDGSKKVVCVSYFMGKPVRGVAICGPTDSFDIEAGKKLAQRRCDLKIAEKRKARYESIYVSEISEFNKAAEKLSKARDRYDEVCVELEMTKAELDKVVTEMAE